MRIIAGTNRGLRLAVPDSVTRPTADRTREALFSILGDHVPGSHVLDLFAGSGALGLESLSRGAESATFVEQNRAASEVIAKNISKAHFTSKSTVRRGDVSQFLNAPSSKTPFDLIFADPPYQKRPGDTDHASALLTSNRLRSLITEDGIFVLEDSSSRVLDTPTESPEENDLWELICTRTYGAARLRLFRPRNPE